MITADVRTIVKTSCFILLALLAGLLWPQHDALAGRNKAEELQKLAQQAFAKGEYAEAEAINLNIAINHPGTGARRYAVQILAGLYENNLVDLENAVRWYRVFLNEYAGPGQVPFVQEKLIFLEELKPHEKAFATYQEIRHANADDLFAVRKYESLLEEHPDFPLKPRVLKELGYAYGRLDKSYRSYRAFQALAESGSNEFSAEEKMAYGKVRSNLILAVIAWMIILLFWAAALSMDPWARISRASIITFMIFASLWLLLAAVRLPSYYAVTAGGEENLFPPVAVYVAAALNIPVLFWVLLLTRGKFWQSRPRALLWLSPLLTLLMTVSAFYLFLFYQPDGSRIVDAFAGQYGRWIEAVRNPAAER